MELKELRYGNYFNYDGVDYQLEQLDGSTVVIHTPEDVLIPDVSEVNAIELTKKWMKKLGFKKEGGSQWAHKHHVFFTLQEFYIDGKLDGFVFEYGGSVMNRVIKEVHVLQNAFWFTGTELKIKE